VPVTTTSGEPSDGTIPTLRPHGRAQALRHEGRLRRDHGHGRQTQHEPQRIISDLLTAEISEKQARSIKYQLTIAKLPLAKDLDDFQFGGTPINETLVNELAAADSSPNSATPCWSGEPAPARPI
jgi:IstB-like ATP binding protein